MTSEFSQVPGLSADAGRWLRLITWVLVPVLVALDQWTKNFIVTYYYLWEVDPIIGEVLRLTRVHNQGAAFGVLQQWPGLFKNLTGFAILALTAHKLLTRNHSVLYHVSLGLVLSGAVGNFIDRLRFNYVVDFIQVGFNGWYWPSFNVADSAITVGVILLLWGSFFTDEHVRSSAPGQADDEPSLESDRIESERSQDERARRAESRS